MLKSGALIACMLALGVAACGDPPATRGDLPAAGGDPPAAGGGAKVAVKIDPLGAGAVVYDLHLFEQSADPRTFVEVATYLAQPATSADGSFQATFPCHVLSPGALGRIDVIARQPAIPPSLADQIQPDFGELDRSDLVRYVGNQLAWARQSLPFRCAADAPTSVHFATQVAARTGAAADLTTNLASMSVPLKDQTLAMDISTTTVAGSPVAAVELSVSTATAPLPALYVFGFGDRSLGSVNQSDSVEGAASTRSFHASWQLPAPGAPYSLNALAMLFPAGAASRVSLGDTAYVWSNSVAGGDPTALSVVDGFRLVTSGQVTDDAQHVNVGALFNCETANVPGYTSTGVLMVYANNVVSGQVNTLVPRYFIHMSNGQPVAAQAIGALDRGGGEFGVILHEVEQPQVVFAAKCGFARPGPSGGLIGACDEQSPGSGILSEYSLAELAATP
jgi:hypothetical protein